MSSFKKLLMDRGLQLMSDPRVLKLMQDERVMKAVLAAASMPGRMQSFTAEQVERIVRSMALVREDEVQDLRRTVRRLEEQVAKLQREPPRPPPAPARAP